MGLQRYNGPKDKTCTCTWTITYKCRNMRQTCFSYVLQHPRCYGLLFWYEPTAKDKDVPEMRYAMETEWQRRRVKIATNCAVRRFNCNRCTRIFIYYCFHVEGSVRTTWMQRKEIMPHGYREGPTRQHLTLLHEPASNPINGFACCLPEGLVLSCNTYFL
jgi:hypothetical protein